MESLNTLPQNKKTSVAFFQKRDAGFTLIEILIAMALMAIIFSFGLFISMDFYKSYSFMTERDTTISTLQKARSQSLNNINEKRHGVHFFINANNALSYLLFECETTCTIYPGTSKTDVEVPASQKSSVTNPKLPFDVIFEQLSGNCVISSGPNPFTCQDLSQPIIISDGVKSYTITINSEGRID